MFPHLAAVLKNSICEAAVTLGADLHIIGPLQQQSFLQVSIGLIHVGNAVLAVIGEVLRSLGGQQSQESHLNACGIRCQIVISIAKLWRQNGRKCIRQRLSKSQRMILNQLESEPGPERERLTWNPPFMASPNQTCLRSAPLEVHQLLRGILAGFG